MTRRIRTAIAFVRRHPALFFVGAFMLGFIYLQFFVVGPQMQADTFRDRAAATEFADRCLAEGRRPTECVQACRDSTAFRTCRARVMEAR